MTELAQLEEQKARLIEFVSGWSQSRLQFRPNAHEWSALQVLDHLVRVEQEILAAAQQGAMQPHRIGLRDRIGFLFLARVFRSERRVKVPASAVRVLPGSSAHLPKLLEGWQKVRTDLADFSESLTPDQARGGLFRHPVSGWMTFPMILQFFALHLQHHKAQFARLFEASGSL